MAPPRVPCGHSSRSLASLADSLENLLICVDSVPAVPLSHYVVCRLEFFMSFICRTVPNYHILCASIVIVSFCDNYSFILFFNGSIFFLQKIPFVQLFHPQLQFNYCSITVWLLFIILILEMYSRYFDPVARKLYPSSSSILKPVNIIQVQDSPTFILA
jgi:hypothetical protein